MNGGGFTINPETTENADGSMNVSFNIEDHDSRLAQIEQFNQTEHYNYSSDEFGEARHVLADFDTQLFEQVEDNFVEELTNEDYQTDVISPEDLDYIYDSVGGQTEYQEMIQWASTALNPQAINQFDALLQTGDIGEIEASVQSLHNLYMQQVYGDETEVVTPQSNQDFYNLVGGEANYQQLMQLAQQHLPQQHQDAYNRIMESGDSREITRAVQGLAKFFSN